MGIIVMLTNENETNYLKSYKNNNNQTNILALGEKNGGKLISKQPVYRLSLAHELEQARFSHS